MKEMHELWHGIRNTAEASNYDVTEDPTTLTSEQKVQRAHRVCSKIIRWIDID